MRIALAPSTQAAEYARNLKVAQACKPVLEAAGVGVECRIFASAPLPGDSTAGQSKSSAAMQAMVAALQVGQARIFAAIIIGVLTIISILLAIGERLI